MALLLSSCLALSAPVAALAEEGMWTFDNPPVELLAKNHGFAPDGKWLDHVRLSSVRFMDGGSGSFASPHGLVVTNHHVAAGQLQKMSTAENDYMAKGFYAKELADEIECPDLEVNVLVSTQDVTGRVLAAVEKGMSAADALKARLAERARIEKESKAMTGLRSDVIGLYHGGQYWLYRYEKYTDVRLVMAPERQAAFFGGDSDNFTYPRYDLDVAFFRIYRDKKPIRSEHFLKWNPAGGADGELVFITGHPGRTDRLHTVKQIERSRDFLYPMYLEYLDRAMAALREYAGLGPEKHRRALGHLFGLGNAKKALGGEYRGLKSQELIERRRRAEAELRASVAADPALQEKYGKAWGQIEKIYQEYGDELERRIYHQLFRSNLASKAITIVKYVKEVTRPDADRLDGFHDSELDSLRFRLFSPAPVYRDLEAVLLETAVRFALDHLPENDPFATVLRELGDPRKASEKLCNATGLDMPALRIQLAEGGLDAVQKSGDPLIALARKLAPIMVQDEEWTKKHVRSVTTPARERIARARFAIHGTGAYPDATFSLRMTFGPVAGYPMNGTRAPYRTTLYGLYDRALGFDARGAWSLPERFWERRKHLDLSTPVNFVAECDIIGGNSGSPVIDRNAELVGVVFDGNIESLSNRFMFDAVHSRAVAVHAAYVLEALRKLYDAADLADEITTY